MYIIRLTCNRGDNHGGEEGAVPWELTGERKIPGGVWGGRGEVGCKGMMLPAPVMQKDEGRR